MISKFWSNAQQRLKDGFSSTECFWTPASRILLFCPRPCRHTDYHRIRSSLSPDAALPATSLRSLGVTLDILLRFDCHITEVSRYCHYHMRAFRHIRNCLSHETSCAVARCIVLSRLDYCNSLFHGASRENILKLQMIQNSLVRIIYNLPPRSSTEHLLNTLHWLPISKRITFKVALLAFKCKHGLAPSYLNDLILNYVPTRQLRSSHKDPLFQPRTKTACDCTYSLELFAIRSQGLAQFECF